MKNQKLKLKIFEKIIFLSLFILVATSESHAQLEGHGGRVLICKGQPAQLLDWEWIKEHHWKLNLELPRGKTWEESVEAFLKKLDRVEPYRALIYRHRAKTFLSRAWQMKDYELSNNIPDIREIGRGTNCIEKVVVNQSPALSKMDLALEGSHKRCWVDIDTFNSLPEDVKAGLVLHEAFYEDGLNDGAIYPAYYKTEVNFDLLSSRLDLYVGDNTWADPIASLTGQAQAQTSLDVTGVDNAMGIMGLNALLASKEFNQITQNEWAKKLAIANLKNFMPIKKMAKFDLSTVEFYDSGAFKGGVVTDSTGFDINGKTYLAKSISVYENQNLQYVSSDERFKAGSERPLNYYGGVKFDIDACSFTVWAIDFDELGRPKWLQSNGGAGMFEGLGFDFKGTAKIAVDSNGKIDWNDSEIIFSKKIDYPGVFARMKTKIFLGAFSVQMNASERRVTLTGGRISTRNCPTRKIARHEAGDPSELCRMLGFKGTVLSVNNSFEPLEMRSPVREFFMEVQINSLTCRY